MFLYFMQGIEKTSCIFQTYVLKCVACGTCAEACPAEAISEGDGKYVIDADACLDCGTCEGECPTGAIVAGE